MHSIWKSVVSTYWICCSISRSVGRHQPPKQPTLSPCATRGYSTDAGLPCRPRHASAHPHVPTGRLPFIGNESPTVVGLFDALGDFIATDFTLTGSDIWDAGTEVNQPFGVHSWMAAMPPWELPKD